MLHASPSTSTRPPPGRPTSFVRGLQQLHFKSPRNALKSTNIRGLPFPVLGAHSCQGLDGQVWTYPQGLDATQGGFPSCSAANGADTSNDDADEWDYNTMFSTRSEINTRAAIDNVTEMEYVQARCPESRKTGADIASRFNTQRIGFVHVEQTQNLHLI